MLEFIMRQIVTKQFAVLEDYYEKNDEVGLNLELRFSANKENRMIDASLLVKLLNNECPFLILEVGCLFEIKQNSWDQFAREENSIRIPKAVLCHLAMHAVGTARGVMHVKTEKTCFNCFILPPVNVVELVTDDFLVV